MVQLNQMIKNVLMQKKMKKSGTAAKCAPETPPKTSICSEC